VSWNRGEGVETRGAWTRRLLVVLCFKRRGMVALLYYTDLAPSSAAAAPACMCRWRPEKNMAARHESSLSWSNYLWGYPHNFIRPYFCE
jgi:hypothetical protein